MTEWMTLVKHEMKSKGLSLGEAMKEAKKHYHPKKSQKGGVLVKVGGKRRRHTKKHRGGSLYGFGEGAGGALHGGQGRMTPVGSVADAGMHKGGRRTRRRRHH